MKKTDFYIIVGKVGKSFGIRGWVKIYTYTELGDSILNYHPWFILENKKWERVDVEEAKLHSGNVIAKFVKINNPEAARLETGKLIAIRRTDLPPLKKDEYYWSDLENSTVIDQNGVTLGKVSHLLATGANDVLIVKGNREYAIPFIINKFITKVDLEKNQIIVNWELI